MEKSLRRLLPGGAFSNVTHQRSRTMAAIRGRDTKPEILLGRALRHLGLRFAAHDSRLPGKPDIVFRSHRLVIFVDGDFWHGRHWTSRRAKLLLGNNAAYWVAKIETNVRRDRRTNRALRSGGWFVTRVWESDIMRDVNAIARRVAVRLSTCKRR